MKTITLFSVLASAALSLVAAEELKVDVTKAVACERKTQKGDVVSMHYHGSLAANGEKFDASMLYHAPCQSITLLTRQTLTNNSRL